MKKKRIYCIVAATLVILGIFTAYKLYSGPMAPTEKSKPKVYKVVQYPTTNIGKGTNEVKGIVLHHTANKSIGDALGGLRSPIRKRSSHVIIDKDGTRYILAEPTAITWHAGYSRFKGRERCNEFTIGIEFQGNTMQSPLTEDQINSAIEYILPIMQKYHISKENIVTHQQIRQNWRNKHPDLVKKKIQGSEEKTDITQKEYLHFIKELTKRQNGSHYGSM